MEACWSTLFKENIRIDLPVFRLELINADHDFCSVSLRDFPGFFQFTAAIPAAVNSLR